MRPSVAGGQREGYAAALTGLWKRLGWALTELEGIAADPGELLDEDGVLERLPSLQYANPRTVQPTLCGFGAS